MELAVCSAAITFLILLVYSSAFGSQDGVSIKVVTSQDDQFWTNSVIIEGAHEVMLVDALKKNSTKPGIRKALLRQ